VGWLILRVRNKLQRAAEEARAREAAFVDALGSARLQASPPAPAPARASAVAAPVVPSPPALVGAGAGGALRAYLSDNGAQAFWLLKAALPEHEIFPRGSLQGVLGPLAPGKDLKVDFVVCSADFRPVAVVDLVATDDLPPVVTLKAERLMAVGIAYVRWDGQALPSAAQVAEMVRPDKTA
jgi:hypothetical protein